MDYISNEAINNGVVPKPKPNTTMQHLLKNFLIRKNYHLQNTLNNKAETEHKTFKLHKCQMRTCLPVGRNGVGLSQTRCRCHQIHFK